MMSTYLDQIDWILNPYYQKFIKFLNINETLIPSFLKKPCKFLGLICLSFLVSLFFMDYLLCHLIGILYPMLYCYFVIKNNNNSGVQVDIENLEKSTKLLKYWVSYSLFHILELPILWILQYIPLYFYLKLSLFYYLIRNNFFWINFIYTYIENFLDLLVRRCSFLSNVKSPEEFRNAVKDIKEAID
jgi:hypothetical protein